MAAPILTGRLRVRLIALVLVSLTANGAIAQDPDGVTVEQLREELAQRDAIIVDLLNRVRALERNWATGGSDAGVAADRDSDNVTAGTAVANDTGVTDRDSSDFDVDELAAERALERGLVQEGARLLGPGQLELEPAFAASRRETAFPTTVSNGNASAVGELSRTYEIRESRATLRLGLPWKTQIEIGLPHITVDQKLETSIDGVVQSSGKATGSGAGDATIGISRVLASERGARPNLIGRLAWLSGSGDERDGNVALGGGLSGYSGRLTAYWRRDPVVFLLSGGYTRYDQTLTLRPGDSVDASVGLGLAISPDTAMIFSLSQVLADEFERDSVELVGTDRRAATLDLALSTTLGRRLLLRGFTSAGLTEDAPDYAFGVSLSTRFDHP
jgi:hypothetical protein